MAMKLALVGFGAIGRELARLLQGDGAVEIVQIVVPPRSVNAALRAAAELGYAARVLEALNLTLPLRPDLVVECAGHAAVMSHLVAALRAVSSLPSPRFSRKRRPLRSKTGIPPRWLKSTFTHALSSSAGRPCGHQRSSVWA